MSANLMRHMLGCHLGDFAIQVRVRYYLESNDNECYCVAECKNKIYACILIPERRLDTATNAYSAQVSFHVYEYMSLLEAYDYICQQCKIDNLLIDN